MKPLLFGKYCLLERISVGGMAEVFRAKPFDAPGFQGYLALKRILPHLAEDEEFIKMFVDEAKLTVQLSHPNIVRIFELGQFQSSYYILMEYISGKDVLNIQKTVRKRREIFGVRTACQVAANVASGLHHAHFMTDHLGQPLNIIHRDISPQNILVDFFGNVKVIDFGIAKAAVQSTRTQVGVLKGKMGYMSPEQVSGGKLDHRSDIFAIGTVLWELVTNRRLFNGDNEFETMNLVKEAVVEAPSVHNPDIPPEVDRIILKSLAADREERYASAGEMAQDLEAWLASVNYNKQELSNWMCEVYADDLAEERTKREDFDTIQTADDVRRIIAEAAEKKPEATAGQSASVNEEKTEIWDASILPDENEDLAAFAAQHTMIQAGGFDASAYAQQGAGGPLATPQVDPSLSGQYQQQQPYPPHQGQQVATFQNVGTDPGRKKSGGGGLGALKWIFITIVVLIVGLAGTIGALIVLDGGLGDINGGTAETTPAAPGTIVVSVVPPSGIEIKIDGKPVADASPHTAPELPVGPHVVEVSAEGFKPFQRTIEVGDGALVPVEVKLEPSTPAEGKITLTIAELEKKAEKSLQLFLDGAPVERAAGEAGWTLPAGTHLVEATADDHRPFSAFVELDRDGEESVEVNMLPQVVKLKFPEGAKVKVDGKRQRDLEVELDPTKVHELEISGSIDWKGHIGFPDVAMGTFDPEKVEQGAVEDDFGWLTVSTGKDWWSVMVDGNDTGLITPLKGDNKIPVRAGKRTITLRRGFAKRDIPVDVRERETVVVRQKLEFVFDSEDGS